MQAPEQQYLTALSENVPDTRSFGLAMFFMFGLEALLKAYNREAWASWLNGKIRSVLLLPTTHEDYIRVQTFLNATESKTSPLQICLAYRNRVFYDMFVKLGCREDYLMNLEVKKDEAPEAISIARYARREGIWETA